MGYLKITFPRHSFLKNSLLSQAKGSSTPPRLAYITHKQMVEKEIEEFDPTIIHYLH
jgi:hypothetical protein